MPDVVESSGEWIALAFRKAHAAFVTSGTAALEVALLLSGVGRGDEVIIPEECCPAVPGSVLRVGATPVLAPLDESLVLQPEAVAAQLSKRTRAAIVVHQWGCLAPCAAIRAVLPADVRLVEDAAPYWHPAVFAAPGYGEASDWIVTSFRHEKPLDLGRGGAILSDRPVAGFVDWGDQDMRAMTEPIAPFGVPAPPLSELVAATRLATDQLALRESVVAAVREEAGRGGVGVLGDAAGSCWLRVILAVPTPASIDRACELAVQHSLLARPLHPAPLGSSPMLAGRAEPVGNSPFGRLRDRLLLLWPPLEPDGPERVASWVRALGAQAPAGVASQHRA